MGKFFERATGMPVLHFEPSRKELRGLLGKVKVLATPTYPFADFLSEMVEENILF